MSSREPFRGPDTGAVVRAFATLGRQNASRATGVALGLFLMPVFVMAMVGLAMSGYSTPSLWLGVLDADSAAASALVEVLEADPHLRVRTYDDRERMRVAVYRGRLHGGLIFPAEWTGEQDLDVYASKTGVGTPVLRAILDRALARQREPDTPAATIDVLDGETLGNPPTGYQYTAPSNLVLFVMMNAIIGSVGIVALRRTGLGWRLLAAPLSRRKLMLGLAVSPLQLMGTQAIFLLAVGALIFDVSWGDPRGVALVTVALVAVGVTLSVFLGTLFRTESQPGNLGPFLAILLGMLGGCMWPLEIVPAWVSSLGHLFPTAWAMDGYLALVFGRASWTAVLPEVAVLLGMAAPLRNPGSATASAPALGTLTVERFDIRSTTRTSAEGAREAASGSEPAEVGEADRA